MNIITEPITAAAILNRAAGHQADRAATYDKPEGERSMAQTVKVFEVHHGIKLTEAQGWHFMQILKDVRLFTRPTYHADSAEDCVSYAALKAEAKAKEMPPVAAHANDNMHWCAGSTDGKCSHHPAACASVCKRRAP